jgi:glutathione S-transferase
VKRLTGALDGQEWLLGGRFSAADVMVGSAVAIRLHTGMLPPEPALKAYADRIFERPAFQRAQAVNWPPALFPAA